MIQLEGITKSFGSLQVLKGIDLTINKGEVVSIVGPSGAGKTTLLQIMGTLDKPDAGRIVLNEVEVNRLKDKELAAFRNKEIGFVFQFYNLVQNLTVRENVELATQICKNPLDIDEVIEAVGLKDRSSNFPSQLSGGEQQRAAIARALINKPAILLADEPTGNLDNANSWEIMKLLEEANRRGTTVVVVTHNMDLVQTMKKRVITIDHGEIISDERWEDYGYED